MKELSNNDTDILVKAWRSVSQTNKRTPMDYSTRLYHTFMRFIFMKGIRLIGPDVTKIERYIYENDLALHYMGALRLVIDPKQLETEADIVMLMISATEEQRMKAIRILRSKGVKL